MINFIYYLCIINYIHISIHFLLFKLFLLKIFIDLIEKLVQKNIIYLTFIKLIINKINIIFPSNKKF